MHLLKYISVLQEKSSPFSTGEGLCERESARGAGRRPSLERVRRVGGGGAQRSWERRGA